MRFNRRPVVVLCVWLLYSYHNAIALPTAGQRLDSLLRVTKAPTFAKMTNAAKVAILWQISGLYGSMRSDAGRPYAALALKLSEEFNDYYGQGVSFSVMGRFYASSGADESLDFFFRSLAAFEKAGSDSGIARAYYDIGGVYYNIDKFPKALKYFKMAEHFAERLPDKMMLANARHSLAATNGEMKNYGVAMAYDSAAMQYYQETGNMAKVAICLSNIAGYKRVSGSFSDALPVFRAALAFHKAGDTAELYYWEHYAHILNEIGACYLNISIGADATQVDGLLPEKSNAALDSSIAYLTKALEAYRRHGVVSLDILNNLSDAMAVAGRYREALLMHKQYVTLRDSAMANDVLLKMAAKETQREVELKEKQVDINRLEREQRKHEQWLFTGGITVLAVILLLVARSYRQQQRANRLNVELLKQKDMLMKEIHHRVKNNLQVISTLLDLQLNSVADDVARVAMTESASRVRSISLIHHQLYQHDDIGTIEFARFARNLFHQVSAVFRFSDRAVVLDLDMPQTELDIDTAMPLGLILNELLTNSFKYAFADGADGKITIRLGRDNEQYVLWYGDSGPGLPAGVEIKQLKTLGMKLLHRLSKQLGGNFSYLEKKHIFMVVFKDLATRKKTD